MHVSFGSDGFRGVIGHTLTQQVVARIVLGAAHYVRSTFPDQSGGVIPVGYDTRFLSEMLARFAARLLVDEGYAPLLAHRPCPSPYLAFATYHLEAPIGLQFTASHNPAIYNGIKLKGQYGGSLLPAAVKQVEHYANALPDEQVTRACQAAVWPEPEGSAKVTRAAFDVEQEYRLAVTEAADWSSEKAQMLIVDYMHGATAGLYHDVLGDYCTVNTALRTNPDPLFAGGKPEPLAEHLAELMQHVEYEGHDSVGVAFDGDGDRLAVVDERGRLLETHEVFCLLLEHLVAARKARGVVVTTVSFSGLVQRAAEALGCTIREVPVGFKDVSQAMLEHDAIIGGEESGGTGFGHYLPERDALLMALMLLAERKRAALSLDQMVAHLYQRYGRSVYVHRDLVLPAGAEPDAVRDRLRDLANLSELAGDPVVSLSHLDGMKLRTATGWVLARASGTEPLVRIYGEAALEGQAEAYVDTVAGFLGLK